VFPPATGVPAGTVLPATGVPAGTVLPATGVPAGTVLPATGVPAGTGAPVGLGAPVSRGVPPGLGVRPSRSVPRGPRLLRWPGVLRPGSPARARGLGGPRDRVRGASLPGGRRPRFLWRDAGSGIGVGAGAERGVRHTSAAVVIGRSGRVGVLGRHAGGPGPDPAEHDRV